MSETKLLNCPFCGGEAKVAHYSNGWDEWWHIVCKGCHISQTGSYKRTEEEAIKAWNTRVPMKRIIERLERKKKDAFDTAKAYELDAWWDGVKLKRAEAFALLNTIQIVKEEGGIE